MNKVYRITLRKKDDLVKQYHVIPASIKGESIKPLPPAGASELTTVFDVENKGYRLVNWERVIEIQ